MASKGNSKSLADLSLAKDNHKKVLGFLKTLEKVSDFYRNRIEGIDKEIDSETLKTVYGIDVR